MSDKNSMNSWAAKIDLRIRQFQYFKDNNQGIFAAVSVMAEALKKGNKILIFGNGGSAVQASHFAAELVNKFYFERDGLASVALTTDPACLTSIANDLDFKYVFSRQLEALGKAGDIAVGLSTSGKSPNVLEALRKAKQLGAKTIALCGQNTQPLDNPDLNIDVILSVPSADTPLIQELHLFILHTMAEQLEKILFGGDE